MNEEETLKLAIQYIGNNRYSESTKVLESRLHEIQLAKTPVATVKKKK
jgi:hypothetical protein